MLVREMYPILDASWLNALNKITLSFSHFRCCLFISRSTCQSSLLTNQLRTAAELRSP
jgi:hypothetical protein